MGQVVKKPDTNVVRSDDYLALAIERGVAPEVLSKLIDNAARIDAIKARKEFDSAMSSAKAEIPVVFKNKEVDFVGKTGIRTHYFHEDMAEIARTVDPILAKHGLSYRFRTSSNGAVTVTCVISHRDGHSEENSLTAGRDETGNKNAIQAIGSTITFLQRYTLKAALGLAASSDDDASAATIGNDLIGSDEIIALDALIKDVGGNRADELKAATLKYLKIGSLAELPMRDFGRAKTAVEKKRK